MVVHLFDCKWVVLLVEPLLFVGVVLAEEAYVCGILARGIRSALRIRGSNAHLL